MMQRCIDGMCCKQIASNLSYLQVVLIITLQPSLPSSKWPWKPKLLEENENEEEIQKNGIWLHALSRPRPILLRK